LITPLLELQAEPFIVYFVFVLVLGLNGPTSGSLLLVLLTGLWGPALCFVDFHTHSRLI
jgi:hypothetical protein